MEMKDRKDILTHNGDTYEMILIWGNDYKISFCGMSPKCSGIRKNGKLIADISCDSNNIGFWIKEYHGDLLKSPKWKVPFIGKDINKIPFIEIVKNICGYE